jgi:hypothetical protein
VTLARWEGLADLGKRPASRGSGSASEGSQLPRPADRMANMMQSGAEGMPEGAAPPPRLGVCRQVGQDLVYRGQGTSVDTPIGTAIGRSRRRRG